MEKENIPSFNSGDTVRVGWEVHDNDETRVQTFEGVVIAKKGKEDYKTFTVRRIASGRIGVERIFPLFSPRLKSLEVLKEGKARRSKLYYLRDREGKNALRVKERNK
ncbi:MAG: 50S ribosomal protein L19 [Patescibacteria group bacterium]